jgi:hypothetical protein
MYEFILVTGKLRDWLQIIWCVNSSWGRASNTCIASEKADISILSLSKSTTVFMFRNSRDTIMLYLFIVISICSNRRLLD